MEGGADALSEAGEVGEGEVFLAELEVLDGIESEGEVGGLVDQGELPAVFITRKHTAISDGVLHALD